MEFRDLVEQMKKRSVHATEHALTEEATKTSVILPFLQMMGFDIFNLNEVIPEFVADVGIKKGEKVDFALKIDGRIAVLIEVKPITQALGSAQFSQLYRYFGVTTARLGILTNGREFWFFSDIDEKNKMDPKPFFTFDLQGYQENHIHDLARFRKADFSLTDILAAAEKLQAKSIVADFLDRQMSDPDEDFVRLIARQVHTGGNVTKGVLDNFRPIVQSALDEVVRRRISDRLNIIVPEAIPVSPAAAALHTQAASEPGTSDESEISADELQAFMIVRAIAARLVDIERIFVRDAKSYCGIFVDDNNRKPVCRLHFNSRTAMRVGIFDDMKNETRIPIDKLSDLYKISDKIEEAVKRYA